MNLNKEKNKVVTKGVTKVSVIATSENDFKIRNYDEESRNAEHQILLCKLDELFTLSLDFELSKITTLHLENCTINELPRDIRELQLKQLILKNNNLKEVPNFLYLSLEKLELLDLSNNLIETFDIEPACKSNIITLRICNNKIYNFPHWILSSNCPKLIEIDYSCNFIRNLNVKHKLTLKKLEMRNTQLRNLDFVFFMRIKTLEYLDISNTNNSELSKNENDFKDIKELFSKARWKSLKVLKMNNLCISIIPNDLFWFDSLTELYLVNCDLSWIPQDVQYLTNLKLLDVSYNSVCSIPSELSTLPNLIIIKAQFNAISSVADFVNDLEILDLYENELEAFPNCIDGFKLIDLERNIIDMSLYKSYNTYLEKRNRLRQILDDERTEGPKIILSEPSDDNDDVTSLEEYDDVCETSEFYDANAENEKWDDEEPNNNLCTVRNPLVTPSDDEWDGSEEVLVKEKKKIKPWFDVDEDWIFTDVD